MLRRARAPLTLALAALLFVPGCYAFARRALDLPEFESGAGRHYTEHVAMRDGVRLRTDVYLPKGEGPWPVIVVRNPYNFWFGARPVARLFSRYGYVGVHQLTRGRRGSEGEWLPFFNERDDGLDTLDWIVAQPWQDGNIGLLGASYLSMVQWAVADVLPPEVKTMVPMVWGSDVHGVAYEGGMFRHEVATVWAALMHDDRIAARGGRNYRRAIAHRPHAEAAERFFKGPLPWYEVWLESASLDAPIWQLPDARHLQEIPRRVQVPVLMITGWYDIFLPSQIEDYLVLGSREESRLIVGPWTHLMGLMGDGERPLPEAGTGIDLMDRVLDWFDHHLKGAPLPDWGPIETYAIGDGSWRIRPDWPPPTEPRRFHLHDAEASVACGGGRLRLAAPRAKSAVAYVYDPEDPVPSRGGAGMLRFALPGWRGVPPSMRDQRGLCERPDVLSFVSAPLAEDLHLAGEMRIRLTVSSDAEDTAFTVKIIDVDPEGVAVNVRDTITALAFRNGAKVPVAYTPGERITLELSTWPIEWTLPAGHRLRVDVSSSNFPAYHAHPNLPGPWAEQRETRPAVQTLHLGPDAPGWVEVPVLSPIPDRSGL
jgi:uncharacterized protein